MCAINGITEVDHALVERMNAATRHRGPDGSRIWSDAGITLGHNRLAIIDLSDAALQPMASTDGRYMIVFNGEIYNYRELRNELEGGYTFTTQSDTEVLIAAYARWGEAMLSKLRGIFAFGIWDTNEETLLLVRDHMGVKPLYYHIDNGVLAFSSEIPALLTRIAQPHLDRESLSLYLAMEYVPAPQTLVRGIQKLPAAHLLTYRHGVITTRSYRDVVPHTAHVKEETIYDAIDSAVTRQLVSDRPVGAYLSGGFDSSIVVHHMVQHAQHTRTYSVNFEAVRGEEEEAKKFNVDAMLAERTAQFYGTEHKTLTITLADIQKTIEIAAGSANEPVANSTAITQYLLSDFVRKDGTVVVLGGDGGDELFGGYTRHRIAMGAYMYQQLPGFVQQFGALVSPRVGKLATPFGTPLHRALMVKDEKKIRPFLSCDLAVNRDTSAFFDAQYAQEAHGGVHPLDTFMRVDRRTWLPDECFIRSDYASMAHGVELRVPFVDIDVVTMSDQISVWRKTLPHEGKRIIRNTYKPYLPPHLYGQPKRGWLSPAAKWFRDPVIYDLAKNVFSSTYYSGLDEVFDWTRVREHLDAHVEKRGYYLYPLWNILVLQIWARECGVKV
jgi:asparagine synthase (glutamine-hydrolysing)